MFEKLAQDTPLLISVIVLAVTIVALIVVLIVVCVKGKNKAATINSDEKTVEPKQEAKEEITAVKEESTKEKAVEKKETVAKEKTVKKSPSKKAVEIKEEKVETIAEEKPKATKKSTPKAIKEEKTEEPAAEVNTAETEEAKERAQKYMITFDKEQKLWVVRKTNAKKASKKFKTKAEAYTYAERLANDRDMALTVKKKDGKFQKAENAKKSVSARKTTENN